MPAETVPSDKAALTVPRELCWEQGLQDASFIMKVWGCPGGLDSLAGFSPTPLDPQSNSPQCVHKSKAAEKPAVVADSSHPST